MICSLTGNVLSISVYSYLRLCKIRGNYVSTLYLFRPCVGLVTKRCKVPPPGWRNCRYFGLLGVSNANVHMVGVVGPFVTPQCWKSAGHVSAKPLGWDTWPRCCREKTKRLYLIYVGTVWSMSGLSDLVGTVWSCWDCLILLGLSDIICRLQS